jgi:arabinoxylan arabinofuranohydrolase
MKYIFPPIIRVFIVFLGVMIPVVLFAQSSGSEHAKKITNPLISEPGMSDPHMLVVGDICYLFTGHDVGIGVQDWVMPDWRIFRSEDLQTWTHVGTISPENNTMGKGNTSCWAGDIVGRNGKYYWYYSNRKLSTGVMVASRPEGPYTEALGKPLVNSFDPTIFTDDDSTPYIIYGEDVYKIARLKDSMIELDETPKDIVIYRPPPISRKWTRIHCTNIMESII